jgi:hypothetical protein
MLSAAAPVTGLAGVWLGALVLAGATPATASGVIEVRGRGQCPGPVEVSAALAGMLPAPSAAMRAARPPDVVELRGLPNEAPSVRLLGPTGDVLAEKGLPWAASCVERAVGDVNGDGYADLIVSFMYSGTVGVYLNNGTGAFGDPVGFETNGWVSSLAVGDVNGDGKLDVVAANANGIAVLLNAR